MKNARQIAVEALLRVDTADGYSNIVLDRLLQESGLSGRDKAFASALFYGVLEKKLTLDHVISLYAAKALGKMDPLVRQLLRIAVYQIACMDSVPDSAAVNESVQLCKSMGKSRASGFVNGVLRSFLRDGGKITLPEPGKDKAGWLSLAYSVPRPLVKLWQNQYKKDGLEALLAGMTQKAPLYARVNTTKTTAEKLCRRLGEEGVTAQPHPNFENCVLLEHTGALEALPSFSEGLFHIQDLASQLAAAALSAKAGMDVLDLCAAPGGKSFTLAEEMDGQGRIVSCDLYEKKNRIIASGADRLGLANIHTLQNDATVFNETLGQFDRVLCDAPCSGLGIIRRKPEIRYKDLQELRELPQIQYKILDTAAKYVKKKGLLLYSTCTLNRHENDYVREKFLQEHPEFEPAVLPQKVLAFLGEEERTEVTLMPHKNGTDGFYFALFLRK